MTTLRGRLDGPDLIPLLREFQMLPLVSVSDAQRSPVPWANWHGTVYHGVPASLYTAGPGDGGYLAFIGRISPEKRPDWAIEISRRTGVPLVIAAKVDKFDEHYFNNKVKPLLNDPIIDFLAEIGDDEKQVFGQRNAAVVPDRLARAVRISAYRGDGLRDPGGCLSSRIGAGGHRSWCHGPHRG